MCCFVVKNNDPSEFMLNIMNNLYTLYINKLSSDHFLIKCLSYLVSVNAM